LRHALEEHGESLSMDAVRAHIQKPGDKIRTYLTGDVLSTLMELLERAAKEDAEVLLALYELGDTELVDALIAHKKRIRVILSNSSKPRGSDEWDFGNKDARKKLKKAGVEVHDRMFNNNRIGHNKFAVLIGAGNKPKAVMTGSTNWTSTGLCGQSNNALIVESPEVALDYRDYWNRLLEDTEEFDTPRPLSARTSNAQGTALRSADADAPQTRALRDGTKITAWFAPNTVAKTKKDVTPPDLAAVFSLMRKAEKAILFACFLPSRSGLLSIIKEAIDIGLKDPSLLVYGAISDPTAMPNYVAPVKRSDEEDEGEGDDRPKKPQPATFDKGRIHIVRAAALTKDDIVGDFESELLKVGNAIIHDKIIVIDPLSDDGVVVTGSHNLGYKASYENDENFVIIQGNRSLIEAYAVHVLDVYDHYRYRAVQQELRRQDKASWDGFLSRDGKWLDDSLDSDRSALARYFAG
jgi:phosphatidylserine/phosphatidylglycerophosphate/cardiolipin synthase-like enzyme